MKICGRIPVVLLSALHSLAGPAAAQTQGIGGLAQAFGTGPNQEGAHPWYRVEVLAFAYNGFDPGEEIFPDEPFEIRLDTRPPKHLITPAPRDSEVLTLPGLADVDPLTVQDESSGFVTVAATPDSPGSAMAAATPDSPGSVTAAATPESPGPETAAATPDSPGPVLPLEVAPDGVPPASEQASDSEDSAPGNGELEPAEPEPANLEPAEPEPADPQEASLIGDLDSVSESEPLPNLGPLGPADDESLLVLLYESMAAGANAMPGDGQYPIRTAYVQRLIASLQTLEDQSKVPLVFDPIPEGPPLPDPDATDLDAVATDLDALGDDTNDFGAIEADADETGAANPAPRRTFRLLRADELELRGALLRLQRDADYTPLAHGGWIQPAYPPDQAVPVDISLLGTVNPAGTVQLHLSRFLHVTADLLYRAPPAPPPLPGTPVADGVLSELKLPLRYALRIQRRVRSGDIHYLDHPAIGLLVVVRPAPVETQDSGDPLSPPRGPAA